jgi:hypothetical protein
LFVVAGVCTTQWKVIPYLRGNKQE